ncbi:MAG: hypothetical protein RBR62_04835 [Bacteroidales bacterium]|jgi:hypothetical protein|nr:hypothetical protein [Bacteroidales bacterium]
MIKHGNIFSLTIEEKSSVKEGVPVFPLLVTFMSKKMNGDNIKSDVLVPVEFKRKVLDVLFDDGKVFRLGNKTVYPGNVISHIVLDRSVSFNAFPCYFEIHLKNGSTGGCVLLEEDYKKLVFSTR